MKCNYCSSKINGPFMKIQNGDFMHGGKEKYMENMAYTVHVGCLDQFASEYDE